MTRFVWDTRKELKNILKHGVDFETARQVFLDPDRRIVVDSAHSIREERFFCIGKVAERILTVRFTCRNEDILIIGAGYWRKGKGIYEKKRP